MSEFNFIITSGGDRALQDHETVGLSVISVGWNCVI